MDKLCRCNHLADVHALGTGRCFIELCDCKGFDDCSDQVNRPAHYISPTGMESIDVIESFGLNFRLGNAVKYILRAGKKQNAVEDLRKAIWYLEREIKKLEAK